MFRSVKFIAVTFVSLVLACCTASDIYQVNREILVSTVWCGERFVPAGTDVEVGAPSGRYLYVFGMNGVLSLYPEESGLPTGEDAEMHHYIYTPESRQLVIGSYGVFTVGELTVDRLRLAGSKGVIDLAFYAGIDPAVSPTSYY